MKMLAAFVVVATVGLMQAQTPSPVKPALPPIVHPDGTITFRYPVAGAAKVAVSVDWLGKPLPMTKGDDGVWTATTPPLAPEIYLYAFEVDGRKTFDSGNLDVLPSLSSPVSMVEVPGTAPEPWDATAVPHGELHVHLYTSKSLQGLTAAQEPYVVYTPPGYDARAAKPYPVLYLLHGWGQTEEGWTLDMKANLILDNLLAAGKIKPMVVVMPLGYGDRTFLRSFSVWNNPAEIDHNTSLFTDALLHEILPAVEREYHVSKDRDARAIAGLSMGGLEALSIGLQHTDQFAWVGGFSAAVHALPYPSPLPRLDAKKADLHLVWIGCGLDDGLLGPNRKLEGYLQGLGLTVKVVEIPGGHVSQVWRENLIAFAPLLFQGN